MLKKLAGLFLIIIILTGGQALGSAQQGTITLWEPEPAVLQVAHPNVWSYPAKWDLENLDNIPPEAGVTFIRLEWEVLTSGGVAGLQVILGKGQKGSEKEGEEQKPEHVFLLKNSSTDSFAGLDPAQTWEVRFRASYWERRGLPLQLAIKRLVIGWEVTGK